MSDILPSAVSWEDGIIGKLQSFIQERLIVSDTFSRAAGTALVATALHNCKLIDQKGPVRTNLSFFHIDNSGEDKTPTLNFVTRIMKKYDNKYKTCYFSIPKFTEEGFTEYVVGAKRKKRTTPPHPVNLIVKDEASKWVDTSKKSPSANLLEYMSELWDGNVQGYYTRSFGYEGNVEVHAVVLAASTEYFLQILKDNFFMQGLGNRICWSTGNRQLDDIHIYDEDFFMGNESDIEFEQMSDDIIADMRILESMKNASLSPQASAIWRQYQYELDVEGHGQTEMIRAFLRKIALNVLKLAMCYAASRKSYWIDPPLVESEGEGGIIDRIIEELEVPDAEDSYMTPEEQLQRSAEESLRTAEEFLAPDSEARKIRMLWVGVDDMERAIAHMVDYRAAWKKLMMWRTELINNRDGERPMVQIRDTIDIFVSLIENSADKYITRKEVYGHIKLKASELDMLVRTLMEAEIIKTSVIQPHRATKPTIVYHMADYMPPFIAENLLATSP